MDKQMLNMEELEQVAGGYKFKKEKLDHSHGTESHNDAIINGVIYVGAKAVEGASWVWNGIKSLF